MEQQMADNVTGEQTVIGIFDAPEDAIRAVDELVEHGFGHDTIGVIGGPELGGTGEHVTATDDTEETSDKVMSAIGKGVAVGGGLGALSGAVTSLIIPGIGPLVAAGVLATAFVGGALGASVGGVMAGLMQAGVDEPAARLFGSALRHGRMLVTVRASQDRVRDAVMILDRNGALDLEEYRSASGEQGTAG
jgi:hypothetical protein